jgi:hypothetical protein
VMAFSPAQIQLVYLPIRAYLRKSEDLKRAPLNRPIPNWSATPNNPRRRPGRLAVSDALAPSRRSDGDSALPVKLTPDRPMSGWRNSPAKHFNFPERRLGSSSSAPEHDHSAERSARIGHAAPSTYPGISCISFRCRPWTWLVPRIDANLACRPAQCHAGARWEFY